MMTTSPVRVRFAPSPTGWLHVGGLRTALYNYLFARHAGGSMILRIEDTDRSRYVEGAAENLLSTLRWAGIDFDEGPDIGGPAGPYVQSERLDIYQSHVRQLIDAGHAYPCFCSGEELEASRKRQIEEGLDPAYDRRCRSIEPGDAAARVAAGEAHTVRMKVPLIGDVRFSDEIRGTILVNCAVIDDQVLLKSDGYPTYHLANVVDDHLMGITHVIRGEEWLPSTSKHVLLYQFFEWTPPGFAHLPLLLNADRSKLSKRQGDVAVEDYRTKGYLPEALLNFVALLGWNTSDDREIYSLEELVREFSLDRVGKAGAVFDLEKLNWFNGQYLRALEPEALAAACAPFMREAGIDTSDPERLRLMVTTLQKHLTLPSDIVPQLEAILGESAPEDDEATAILRSDDARTVLPAVADALRTTVAWDAEHVSAAIKQVQKSTGVKGKGLFMPIRVALTGRQHGPELAGIACIVGRDETLRRIDLAMSTEN